MGLPLHDVKDGVFVCHLLSSLKALPLAQTRGAVAWLRLMMLFSVAWATKFSISTSPRIPRHEAHRHLRDSSMLPSLEHLGFHVAGSPRQGQSLGSDSYRHPPLHYF